MLSEQIIEPVLATVELNGAYISSVIAICAIALLVLNEKINPARRFRRRLGLIVGKSSGTSADWQSEKNQGSALARLSKSKSRDRMLRMSALKDPDFRKYLILGVTIWPVVTFSMSLVGVSWSVSAIIGVVSGLGSSWLYCRRLQTRRRTLIAAEFPAAIDTMVRSLRSGLTLTDTFHLIAEEASPAIATEFRRIEMEREIGLSVPEVMNRFAERLPLQEIKYFVTIVNLQSVTGSSLAETLDTLSDTLRQRRILKEKIITMTADARSSALIIGALPFVVIAALLFVSPDYLSVFYTTVSGKTIIAAALIYMLLGFFIMKEMVKFDA